MSERHLLLSPCSLHWHSNHRLTQLLEMALNGINQTKSPSRWPHSWCIMGPSHQKEVWIISLLVAYQPIPQLIRLHSRSNPDNLIIQEMSGFQGRSYSRVNIWCCRPSCVIKNGICWEGERTDTCRRRDLHCKTSLTLKLGRACSMFMRITLHVCCAEYWRMFLP